MRYLKVALILWVPLAALLVAAAGPVSAQSSLAEVKCSFFDDYVESGYDRAAGMPLAIAVAGDELPADVASAFTALEDGDPVTEEHRIAIVNFFDPACADTATAVGSGASAASGVPATSGSASTGAQPPEQLASTGADMTTAMIAVLGMVLLASGVWVLQMEPTMNLAASSPWARFVQLRVSPGSESKSLPVVAPNAHRFWLLDEEGK